MIARGAQFAALLILSAGLAAAAAVQPSKRVAEARVMIADYRHGDILWENDRTAHRIYARALEAVEPPSGSGIDAWGKKVRWPFMDHQLRSGHHHDDLGEGLDFYNAGGSRGAGGLGIWFDNKLWTSRNYQAVRILNAGPVVADFEVDYAPWPVDVGRKVWETRRFTLPLGTNFTRIISTLKSDSAEDLLVGIGIAKRATSATPGVLTADEASGLLSFWGPDEPGKGSMAVAIRVDPKMVVRVAQDADNHLILLRITPGKPFVYYSAAAWSKGLDFHGPEQWETYVRAQRPDFDIEADD